MGVEKLNSDVPILYLGRNPKMKQTLFWILIVALITAQAAPAPIGIGLPTFLTSPNRQNLKQHGRNKFAVGAGIGILGALTGNQALTNKGVGLATAGLATKAFAHAFQNGK